MIKKERLAAIDGLRAVFGIGIVIYHINALFGSVFPWLLNPVYEYGGYFGNYIFFMISGLVISQRYKTPLTGGDYPFHRFMLKRLRRIYPIYFLSNLAMILTGSASLSLQRTCATFLMISTGWFFSGDMPYNFPAWFICVLMICYILYFMVGKISSRFPAAYRLLCCGLIVWGAVLEVMDWNLPFLYRVCGEGYMNFFLGALLGEPLNARPLQAPASSTGGARIKRAGNLAAAGACIVLAPILGFHRLPGDTRWWITLICACLVTLSLPGGTLDKVLSPPRTLFQAIGQCSLSLTLWHIPIARLWQKIVPFVCPDSRVSFILYLAVTIAAALLSYHKLERPFLPPKRQGEA